MQRAEGVPPVPCGGAWAVLCSRWSLHKGPPVGRRQCFVRDVDGSGAAGTRIPSLQQRPRDLRQASDTNGCSRRTIQPLTACPPPLPPVYGISGPAPWPSCLLCWPLVVLELATCSTLNPSLGAHGAERRPSCPFLCALNCSMMSSGHQLGPQDFPRMYVSNVSKNFPVPRGRWVACQENLTCQIKGKTGENGGKWGGTQGKWGKTGG